jgi:hypothetical protein
MVNNVCSVLCGIPQSFSSFIASGFNPDIGSLEQSNNRAQRAKKRLTLILRIP